MKQSLSIIIPAYNEERYLATCLDAIAAQSVMPDEVIVVDNNSSDGTVALARNYSFVKVVRARKQGIVHARDAGFNAATGDIIGRIDADSILDPDWVSRTKAYFAHHPQVAAVTGKCYFYDAPMRRLMSSAQASMYHGIQPVIAGTQILWGSNMALRSSAWQEVRDHADFSNEVDEDIMLSLRLADAGLQIGRCLGMLSGVSMRRGKLGPRQSYDYLSSWPRNYRAAGRPAQAVLIAGLVPISWTGAVSAGVIRQLARPQASLGGLRALSASLRR